MNVHQSTSSSYLVRVWREPGADSDARFYLRNLKTGEERYLGDAQRLGEFLKTGSAASGEARSESDNTAKAG